MVEPSQKTKEFERELEEPIPVHARDGCVDCLCFLFV